MIEATSNAIQSVPASVSAIFTVAVVGVRLETLLAAMVNVAGPAASSAQTTAPSVSKSVEVYL